MANVRNIVSLGKIANLWPTTIWNTKREGKEFSNRIFYRIMGMPDSPRLEYSTWIQSSFSYTIFFFPHEFPRLENSSTGSLNAYVSLFTLIVKTIIMTAYKNSFFILLACNPHFLPSLFLPRPSFLFYISLFTKTYCSHTILRFVIHCVLVCWYNQANNNFLDKIRCYMGYSVTDRSGGGLLQNTVLTHIETSCVLYE